MYTTFFTDTLGNHENREARNSKVNSNSFRVISLLSKTWKSFWQRTGISGMTNAREAQSSLRKKIWIVLFTVFSILTISAMYHVLHDYSLHPVTTSITNKYQNQVTESYVEMIHFNLFIDHNLILFGLKLVYFYICRYNFLLLQYAIKTG